MWTYEAPLRDMQFVIDELLQAPAGWSEMPAFAEVDRELSRQVLEEAARFASEVLLPINATGDLEGCHWQDGQVRMPAGARDAYQAFVAGGWPALSAEPAVGGQGLPALLDAALNEMLNACNHGWTMAPGLLRGAAECLRAHGSPALRERYLPQLISGEWLATMCLTEAHAGSDLGLLRTRAVPLGDLGDAQGTLQVSGSKIFISGGEHDLTDNIVHLVLARLPEAPAGSRGLSLVLVPKVLPDGRRNAVHCDGIEKKMGLKASPTCSMRFEGATGWLVGEPHRGLAAMFVMMNAARLHVALQGLGHSEAATQNALRHAAERQQGRAATRPPGVAAQAADPIAFHPAMRRTLWRLQALTEGQRVLAYWCAQLLDEQAHHPDAARRQRAAHHVGLLTPTLKSFLTENGHLGADAALQVWGGHGYVHDSGIEQSVRDSRVAMIYEGTNEIQALDLLQRKVLDDGGERLQALLDELLQEAARCDLGDATLAPFAASLRDSVAGLREATAALVANRRAGEAGDAEWPLRVADDYLRATGFTLLAWAWAATARVALQQASDDAWYARKLQAAQHGLQWLLPEAQLHLQRVAAREAALPWIPV